MYTFKLSDEFLTPDEREIFRDCLDYYHLDNGIWDFFDCLFRSGVRGTLPNDFGAVLNTTKQRMVNVTKPMSYFMLCKNSLIQWLFHKLTKSSKIQGDKQMRFYE